MSKRMLAGGSSSCCGRSNSSAVAGAQEIRIAGDASEVRGAIDPAASRERSWGQARRVGQQHRRSRVESEWSIIVDLPEQVPVLPPELIALEAHLGAAIDAILAGRS
jgi:hypothetical protein